MGQSSSKYVHSSNDYELVIKCSKELEYILENEFGATGRGLHEKISSANAPFSAELIKQMRYLATIRNKLIHERGFDAIPDRANFIMKFEKSAQELESIVKSRQGHGNTNCCIMNNWVATDDITPVLYRNTPSASTTVSAGELSLHNVLKNFQQAQVPTLFYSGWFDATARSALQGYCNLPNKSKVIIGPWNHGGLQFFDIDQNKSQITEFDHFTPVLEFLHHHFESNSQTTPCEQEPLVASDNALYKGVEYFMLGENRWHHSDIWPAYFNRQSWYLSMETSGTPMLTNTLSHVCGGQVTISVNGQKSIGGNSRWHATIRIRDPIMYTHWEECHHITFTSMPVDAPLKIAGTPVVTLYLSSSDTDADLFVYLVAVAPKTK
ncbi:hypothetical protein THRCLA_00063, partial [Thraustotheca clavata]